MKKTILFSTLISTIACCLICSAFFLSSYKLLKSDTTLSCNEENESGKFCVRMLIYESFFDQEAKLFITSEFEENYGLILNYPEEIYGTEIENTKVDWDDDGVIIITTLGYELFIPKERYESTR